MLQLRCSRARPSRVPLLLVSALALVLSHLKGVGYTVPNTPDLHESLLTRPKSIPTAAQSLSLTSIFFSTVSGLAPHGHTRHHQLSDGCSNLSFLNTALPPLCGRC